MQLKPWTEIAVPHSDVLKGTFQDAEFAADISRVHEGKAGPEYGDPVQFFERTFITEGMRLLMDGVVRRLNGKGGDPVVQLQTAFGGGKTHTLLAVYHLAGTDNPTSSLRGVSKILDDAGVSDLPRAQIAVIDGNRYSPSHSRKRGNVAVNCLWGEIAMQIGKKAGYDMVADSDQAGTSPGKEILANLLSKFAPCVILMDELVGYLRQFQEGKPFAAGTFDSNLSFIQALTEAVASVPTAVLMVSLPESGTEIGGVMGQKSLAALEKYFGRVQALWKPVATEEAFEIVRRRLFNPITDVSGMEAVCKAFADLYIGQPDAFPIETLESDYLRRLREAYPIHPEIFGRLYEDWSSLDGFQRTRGVLKLMAKVIYRLFQDGSKDLMIMPGSLPLYSPDVRNESIYYLPQGWDPVIERDIDGERAQTTDIDTRDPRLGAVQAARRVSRTMFLGSAPSVRSQMVRGIDEKRINLGVVQPGMTIGVFRDALNRLTDRLHYLNNSDDRYWFDVRPNLRREMEERRRRFDKKQDIHPEIKSRLSKLISRGCFGGIHIFIPSGDLPDDLDLRLCVLPPETPYTKSNGGIGEAAEKILNIRGDKPRQHRNRLIFLAPDTESIGRMHDHVRTYLAWQSIADDVQSMKINLDMLQVRQTEKHLEDARSGLNRMIGECFRSVLCPVQTVSTTGVPGKTEWETVSLNPGSRTMITEIEEKLVSEEILIKQWSPIHLAGLLKQWFWDKGRTEIKTLTLWQNMCDYLYMPRLSNMDVLVRTVMAGVEAGEYFAYADGRDETGYRGLKLGNAAHVVFDDSSLIVELETAKTVLAEKEQNQFQALRSMTDHDRPEINDKKGPDAYGKQPADESAEKKTRFYGTVRLDSHTGKMEFDQVFDEIVSLLTAKPGTKVNIRLDIDAELENGFDETTRRAVNENANTMGFDEAEFE